MVSTPCLHKANLYRKFLSLFSASLPFADNCNSSRPYTERAVVLSFGDDETPYDLAWPFVSQWAILASRLKKAYSNEIEFPEIDKVVGHTLVHYLYHGTYQTMGTREDKGNKDDALEYKIAILTYCAAVTNELDPLPLQALGVIEEFIQKLPMNTVLSVAAEAWSKVPQDDTAVSKHLLTRIKHEFEADETFFASDCFLNNVGKALTFDKTLVQTMVEVYAEYNALTVRKKVDQAVEAMQKAAVSDLSGVNNLASSERTQSSSGSRSETHEEVERGREKHSAASFAGRSTPKHETMLDCKEMRPEVTSGWGEFGPNAFAKGNGRADRITDHIKKNLDKKKPSFENYMGEPSLEEIMREPSLEEIMDLEVKEVQDKKQNVYSVFGDGRGSKKSKNNKKKKGSLHVPIQA